MAFMEKLRHNVFGVFGTILLFIILIVMVWGDASQGGGGAYLNENYAGSVNGENISYDDLSEITEVLTQYEQDIQGKTEVDRDQMQEQAWQFLEYEQLFLQAAAEHGITVSDDQLRDHMYLFPAQRLQSFLRDSSGQFNKGIYDQFLSDPDGVLASSQVPPERASFFKALLRLSEREARMQILQSQLSELTGALYPTSPTLLRDQYDMKNTNASGSFIYLGTNLIPDADVQVSDEEAKAYYDSHLPMYKREASRSLRYIMLRLGPSDKDSAKVQSKFGKYIRAMEGANTPEAQDSVFNALAGSSDFTTQKYTGVGFVHERELPIEIQDTITKLTAPAVIGPVRMAGKTYYVNLMETTDSEAKNTVRAQHILLRMDQKADSLVQDSVKALAEDLLARAKGGADFAALVKEYSADSVSAVDGGDVGWITDTTQFVPEFKEAALKASNGDIVGPVQTIYGYHIIKITDQSRKGYKLRAFSFDVEVSSATRNRLARQGSEIRTRLLDGENFDSIGSSMGTRVIDSPPLTNPNNAVANSWKLAAFAFNSNLNDVSEVIRTKDDAVIVAQLSAITPAGPAPFDEVKEEVIALLKNRKKVDMLKGKAEQIRASLAAGDPLSKAQSIDSTISIRDFASVTPAGSFPDVGQDFALSAAVFKMKPGETSQPVKGERGYYIVRLDSLTVADDTKYAAEKGEFNKQTLTQQRQQVFYRWIDDYRNKSTIIRNWGQ
ncbi:MAG: peptidyl-prolyl cis-trans isomerase [Candidatus Kapaibacterium sp.]